MTTPKRLPEHYQLSNPEAWKALAALRDDERRLYEERLIHIARAFLHHARWESDMLVPPGTELVQYLDADDQQVHVIEWASRPAGVPALAFDRATLAVEFAWTVYAMDRPWSITDNRLAQIVAEPPVSHARLLGNMLAIRSSEWIRFGLANVTEVCIANPPPAGLEALTPVLQSFTDERERYDARASLAFDELRGALELPAGDGPFAAESARWWWMLLDYTEALDEELHRCVLALDQRLSVATESTVQGAWRDSVDRKRLDVCVGILLAYAAMCDSDGGREGAGFTDPLATRAAGSLAWWCQLSMVVYKDESRLGDRITAEKARQFVGLAARDLGKLDGELLRALVRVIPSIS